MKSLNRLLPDLELLASLSKNKVFREISGFKAPKFTVISEFRSRIGEIISDSYLTTSSFPGRIKTLYISPKKYIEIFSDKKRNEAFIIAGSTITCGFTYRCSCSPKKFGCSTGVIG